MTEYTRRTFVRYLGGFTTLMGLELTTKKLWAQTETKKKIQKKINTDVAVIGAGPGGLTAALRAAELGMNVCLLEKTDSTGGVRNGGGGPFGASTHIHKKYGIKGYTKEEAFNHLMEYNHWRIDARLASEYIKNSDLSIKWLEDQGLAFRAMRNEVGGEFNNYTHMFDRHSDYKEDFYACSLLTDRAKANKNIKIFMETPVKKILKNGNCVTGLIAENSSGELIQVEAHAVIIMTGGFMGDSDMIKKYSSYTYKKDLFYTFEMPNLTGDGIKMAWEAGSAKSEMLVTVYKGMPIFGGPHGTRMDWSILANPNLMVNTMGERFMNEAISDRYYYANAIHRQPDGRGFLIFDNTIADVYRNQKTENEMDEGQGGGGAIAQVNDVDEIVAEAKKLDYPYVFSADSLEDLCAQTGIDLEPLKKTINEYNSFCENGADQIFYKDPSYLLPLIKPKYYAAQFCCDSYGAIGGIKINHKTEVVDTNNISIAGLYSGGSDANTMYADTYCHNLSGNFTGFAYTTGILSAANAKKYISAKRV